MKRASADVGFIFIAYNLRRILNIIGIDKLLEIFARFCSLLAQNASEKLIKTLFHSFHPSQIQTPPKTQNPLLFFFFCYFYPKYENGGRFLDGLTLPHI